MLSFPSQETVWARRLFKECWKMNLTPNCPAHLITLRYCKTLKSLWSFFRWQCIKEGFVVPVGVPIKYLPPGKKPKAGSTSLMVENGGNTFLGGDPSILTPATALLTLRVSGCLPRHRCPITSGFSGKVSINWAMYWPRQWTRLIGQMNSAPESDGLPSCPGFAGV